MLTVLASEGESKVADVHTQELRSYLLPLVTMITFISFETAAKGPCRLALLGVGMVCCCSYRACQALKWVQSTACH